MAFADALTRVFLDADDTRILNRASRVLNEDIQSTGPSIEMKSRFEYDYSDIHSLRWTKAAINLHNSQAGRQVRTVAVTYDLMFVKCNASLTNLLMR